MKKLLIFCFALALLFSTVFVAGIQEVNAAKAQTSYLKRKTKKIVHRTTYNVKRGSHWTKRKTKHGLHKSKVVTKHTYSKTKDKVEH